MAAPPVSQQSQPRDNEPEEAYLEHKFGEAYLKYKRRVRRWI